jgi:hypothetical protein
MPAKSKFADRNAVQIIFIDDINSKAKRIQNGT